MSRCRLSCITSLTWQRVKNTRQRIGALIKREVDEYYDRLSFFKKIFISRERIYYEVDDLMNHHLPRRVEEYLRGEAFAQDATLFLNETVDSFMQRPLKDLAGSNSVGQFRYHQATGGGAVHRHAAHARTGRLDQRLSGRRARDVYSHARCANCSQTDQPGFSRRA